MGCEWDNLHGPATAARGQRGQRKRAQQRLTSNQQQITSASAAAARGVRPVIVVQAGADVALSGPLRAAPALTRQASARQHACGARGLPLPTERSPNGGCAVCRAGSGTSENDGEISIVYCIGALYYLFILGKLPLF